MPQVPWNSLRTGIPAPATSVPFFCASIAARLGKFFPGLAIVTTCTISATFLADHYGMPLTLAALLIGFSFSFLNTDHRLHPGLSLASGTFLRIGIVLIGARVTLDKIAAIGFNSLALVAGIVTLTIASAILASRAVGMSRSFGALAGGAVAICGASAALAFATLLHSRRDAKSAPPLVLDLTLVLVGISIFSAIAMVAYPVLARHLGLSDLQAGFMLGASIHDVAQSISAGFAFSPMAGETATIIKLTRVALLAPALIIYAAFLPQKNDKKRPKLVLPWFVLGFIIVVGANSAGWLPPLAEQMSNKATTTLLAMAVGAAAIQSPTRDIINAGWRPLFTIVAASLVALLSSLLAARFSL